MKFIFPENYNFKSKLLGIIDYPTAIANAILLFLVYKISCLHFVSSFFGRLIFVIILYFPILLVSVIGFNHESFLYIVFYVLKFLIKPKIYLYQ